MADQRAGNHGHHQVVGAQGCGGGVDYNPDDMRKVWDATNDQDRRLAEENQRGINSTAYQPGPYSKTYEFGVVNFIDWYSQRVLENLGAEPAAYLKEVSEQ